MNQTLYEVLDSWTLEWDRGLIEIILNMVAEEFYKLKHAFYLIEDIWNLLELTDGPLEFLTGKEIGDFLRKERNEKAAKSVRLEITESPRVTVNVLNAQEIIAANPDWFKPWVGMTLSEFGAKLLDDLK